MSEDASEKGDSGNSKHNSPEDPNEEPYKKKRKKINHPKLMTKYELEDDGMWN